MKYVLIVLGCILGNYLLISLGVESMDITTWAPGAHYAFLIGSIVTSATLSVIHHNSEEDREIEQVISHKNIMSNKRSGYYLYINMSTGEIKGSAYNPYVSNYFEEKRKWQRLPIDKIIGMEIEIKNHINTAIEHERRITEFYTKKPAFVPPNNYQS